MRTYDHHKMLLTAILELSWKEKKSNLKNGRREQRTANLSFGVIGVGRCNLYHQQHGSSCSGKTFFNLAFCCYFHFWYFNWALVRSRRFSNPPITFSTIDSGHCTATLNGQNNNKNGNKTTTNSDN